MADGSIIASRGASAGSTPEVRVDKKAKTPKKPKTAKAKPKTA